MKNGNVIIGVFVKRFKILSFLEFLYNVLKIHINNTFIFTVEDNENEYLVTFSANKAKQHFTLLHDFAILHTKNQCLFSINALNAYINELGVNSINNNEYSVDWDNLKNTLLIMTNGTLKKLKLTKIDNKCILLSDLN